MTGNWRTNKHQLVQCASFLLRGTVWGWLALGVQVRALPVVGRMHEQCFEVTRSKRRVAVVGIHGHAKHNAGLVWCERGFNWPSWYSWRRETLRSAHADHLVDLVGDALD